MTTPSAAATSLNGSGPGYFFRIAHIMASCATDQGIPKNAALSLAASTMAGAAEMLRQTGIPPETLAQNVAVPGGTTQAAFQAMDRANFDKALREAMLACAARAKELGK